MPEIDWCEYSAFKNTRQSQCLLDIIQDYLLFQHVHDIKRFASNSTLDLVFSNDPSLVHEVDIKPDIRDHERVVFKLSVKPIINKPASKISNAFNESNMYDLKTAFSQAEWPSDNEDTKIYGKDGSICILKFWIILSQRRHANVKEICRG